MTIIATYLLQKSGWSTAERAGICGIWGFCPAAIWKVSVCALRLHAESMLLKVTREDVKSFQVGLESRSFSACSLMVKLENDFCSMVRM